ncbi:MAG TPA: PAS domain S-box protein [Chitinophagaceae bacterium]
MTSRLKLLPECFRYSTQFFYIILDDKGNYLQANNYFKNKFLNTAAGLHQYSFFKQVAIEDFPACINAFQTVLAGSEATATCKQLLQATSGKWHTIQWELSLIRDDNNTVSCIQCMGVDKTHREEDGHQALIREVRKISAKKTWAESEKRFRHLADSVPVMIWMSDLADTLTYVNKSWIDFTGITPQRLRVNSWESLIHPEDVEATLHESNTAFRLQKPVTLIYRLLSATLDYRWVIETSIPRILEDGSFIGFIGSIVDINDQKIKEDQLRYQATILENVSDIIVFTELDGTIKTCNGIAENFYGVKKDEVTGKNVKEIVSLDYGHVTRDDAIGELFSNGIWKGEAAFTNKKGEKKYLLNTISLVKNERGENIGILTLGRDVTERKMAERQLEQSELFYRNLIANSLDGILIVNEDGIIRFSTSAVQNILGYSSSDILGKNCFSYVHPDDLAKSIGAFKNEVEEKSVLKSLVVRLLTKDGSWLCCMLRSHNLASNPHINGIVIYFYDDTLRTQARAALKESESRFRNLISDLQLGVMLVNEKRQITLCNKNGLELLGFSEEQLIGKSINDPDWDFICENGKPLTAAMRPGAIAFKTKKTVTNFVMGILHQDARERVWVLTTAVPILNDMGEVIHIVTSFADITQRKKLEQKLIDEEINKQRLLTQATIDGQEKERKEIGKELHDNIGQQLTTTKLFLDIARKTADENTIEMLNMSITSISDIINEIRSMSRSLVPPTLGDLGLVESVTELCYSLRRTQAFNIRFYHKSFNEQGLQHNQNLMIYRIIQEQLNNIIKHSEAKSVILKLSSEGGLISLDIVDNGKGFDLEKSKKGLGLLNIVNRAELFHGKVEIVTAVNKGCKLKVTFPCLSPVAELN